MPAIDLPLVKLRRRPDARPICQDVIQGMAESIREIGVMNPLRVRSTTIFEGGQRGEGWEIIAGNHRFESAQRAGLNSVPCVVVTDDDLHAELAMIDENLMRAELSPADRAKGTARRKEIYVELHPETARHVAGAHGSNLAQGNAGAKFAPAFTESTAATTGRSQRAIQLDAERGEKISDRALSLVAGTHLDSGSYLDKLKRLGPKEQEARVERELAAGPAPRKPISPAPAVRNEFESYQAFLNKVVKLFDGAPQEWRDAAINHLRADLPVMDRGAA